MKRVRTALIEHGRATEWLTASELLMFGLILALPGNTLLSSPSYAELRAIGLTEMTLAAMLLIVGTMRLCALYINGNWRRTPWMRAAGAMIGMALFSMLSVSAAWAYFVGGSPALSTGAGAYGILALFDALAAYRSGADARVAQLAH
jgi:hypothetical protein